MTEVPMATAPTCRGPQRRSSPWYAAASNRRPGTPRSGRSGADSDGGLTAMLAACGH
jgi:hypothetical protein